MFKSLNAQQKKVILRAGLINVSLAIGVSIAWYSLLYAEQRGGHTLPTWLDITESVVAFYALYRLAFSSLAGGYFNATRRALLTVIVVIMQDLTRSLTAFVPFNPNRDQYKLFLHDYKLVILTSALIAIGCILKGLIVYYFAKRQASKAVKSFKAEISVDEAQIGGRFHGLVLLYVLFTTVAGGGTILSDAVSVVAHHHYLRLTDLVSWVIFLAVIWLALRAKPMFNDRIWQILAPLSISLDIINVAITSHGRDLLLNLLLSVPLYAIAAWYAYRFMPAMKDREINHVDKKELFV